MGLKGRAIVAFFFCEACLIIIFRGSLTSERLFNGEPDPNAMVITRVFSMQLIE